MKILIMGLPGSGKTYLAERLQPLIEAAWYNADKVRGMAGDWDFSDEGRARQSLRMKTFADFESSHNYQYNKDKGKPLSAFEYANQLDLNGDSSILIFCSSFQFKLFVSLTKLSRLLFIFFKFKSLVLRF